MALSSYNLRDMTWLSEVLKEIRRARSVDKAHAGFDEELRELSVHHRTENYMYLFSSVLPAYLAARNVILLPRSFLSACCYFMDL